MVNKLKTLHNTLCMIETKGNNTMLMAECLKFLAQSIQELEQNQEAEQSEEK